ncbi:MAG: mannose-1-phosphate guanylyltransferase/mannose-6-phosphate isomerase [Chloroflexi bacterium]|nr:mannose-1-phosphate guanylyltransferase/mannose-6-phosphate isomerase [Chloroflexota bacterium]
MKKGEPRVSSNGSPSFLVETFVEKPSQAVAESMLESEAYLWNSGMFIVRASVWMRELRRQRPDIADACLSAHSGLRRDGDFYRPDADHFSVSPSESIDYAVMESMGSKSSQGDTSECLVLPMEIGWTDLGAWSSMWEEKGRDEADNVILGDVYARSMSNSLLISQRRLLAAVGLDDVIIIETPDAVLAAHKSRVQEVKELVEQLKSEARPEQENHLKINRPWGSYETIDAGDRFQVKRLTITPGEALSLQMHHHRAEHWVVVKGTAKVTRGKEEFLLTENQSTYVPVGVDHRLENPGTLPLEVVEVQTGSYLEEDDIVRFEDRYDRHLRD